MAAEIKSRRDKQRLIEVIQSLGDCNSTEVIAVFAYAYAALRGYDLRKCLLNALEAMAEDHKSDHIRSLAADALYHLKTG